MRRPMLGAAAAVLGLTLGSSGGATGASPAVVAVFTPSPGHRIAGFGFDREWLALAEDPDGRTGCPVVRLLAVTGGQARSLTRPGGVTCRLGHRFWVRPGARAIGVAIVKALWVVRDGDTAVAVKASPQEPEQVLARVTVNGRRGPFLGPVVATNWLRLFARYARSPDGQLSGDVISGNGRTLWSATGPVLPLGLDDEEHAVSVGADGEIAMWHAHGARYGRVPDAHARAAALDHGLVVLLRSDRARLDVRRLSGQRIASWPVAAGAASLLDADGGTAVYLTGRSVHELDLSTGADRTVAVAPRGTALLDAQIERGLVAYAYRGGPAGPGRLVVVRG
jgi:hypothetical protein